MRNVVLGALHAMQTSMRHGTGLQTCWRGVQPAQLSLRLLGRSSIKPVRDCCVSESIVSTPASATFRTVSNAATSLAGSTCAQLVQSREAYRAPDILAGLNDEQRAAVTSTHQHNRVLAGPGSGKTRVVAARIAQLVDEGVHPDSILAITFTNKAADELRKRVLSAVGAQAARKVTAGTFHSLAVRILRRHIHHLPSCGRDCEFSIYDEDDCSKLMKRAIPLHWPNDEGAKLQVDLLLSAVGTLKNCCASVHGLRGEQLVALAHSKGLEPVPSHMKNKLAAFYDIYTDELCQANAVDFDDLLSLSVAVLWDTPAVQARLQTRWSQLLVDEFQDTNLAQYELVTLLAGDSSRLFVVGDPNQAIYSWRGAHPEHLNHSMVQQYAAVGTYSLAYNYRSASPIVRAAEAVLCAHRRPALHTDAVVVRGQGDEAAVVLHKTQNEYSQASVVGGFAKSRQQRRQQLRELAVLYRTNAEANLVESSLLECGVPCHVAGSLDLWQRMEVKDVMAMMRLVARPTDDVALSRVLDLPVCKGLGKTTIAKLAEVARQCSTTLAGLLLQDIDSSLNTDVNPAASLAASHDSQLVQSKVPHEPSATALEIGKDLDMLADVAGPLPAIPGIKLTKAQGLAIARLRGLIARARQRAARVAVAAGLCELLVESGYLPMLQDKKVEEERAWQEGQKLKGKSAAERLRSLELLQVVARCPETYGLVGAAAHEDGDEDKDAPQPGTSLPTGFAALQQFLEFTSLKSEPADNVKEDAVQLMSLHAAKGKEFDDVLMIGCDKLPCVRSEDTRPDPMGEETRLCYVGMTRARHHLAMLWPMQRKQWGGAESEQAPQGHPYFIQHILRGRIPGVQQVDGFGGPSWWASSHAFASSSSAHRGGRHPGRGSSSHGRRAPEDAGHAHAQRARRIASTAQPAMPLLPRPQGAPRPSRPQPASAPLNYPLALPSLPKVDSARQHKRRSDR